MCEELVARKIPINVEDRVKSGDSKSRRHKATGLSYKSIVIDLSKLIDLRD